MACCSQNQHILLMAETLTHIINIHSYPYTHLQPSNMFSQDYPSADELCSSAHRDPLHRSKMLQSQSKIVRFSDYSQLYHIPLSKQESKHRSEKTYTRNQLKSFQAQAFRDALRVRLLIARQKEKQPSASTSDVVKYAIGRGALKMEHFVGIEHLIHKDGIHQRELERRAHMRSVLDAQELLQQKLGRVETTMLAKFASMSSTTSANEARMRASIVVSRGTCDQVVTSHRKTVGSTMDKMQEEDMAPVENTLSAMANEFTRKSFHGENNLSLCRESNNSNGSKNKKTLTLVVEDVPLDEDEELRELHSVWRNRAPEPGQWMQPVDSFDRP